MGILIVALPLTAFIIVWYLHKNSFQRDYMKLLESAQSEDSDLAKQKLLILEEHRRNSGLRRAVMALALGPSVALISFLSDLVTDPGLANAMIVGGILIAIYGATGLLTWVLIDRKRAEHINQL